MWWDGGRHRSSSRLHANLQIDAWKYVAKLVIKACFLILGSFGTLVGILGIFSILEQSRVILFKNLWKALLKGRKITLLTLRTAITCVFLFIKLQICGGANLERGHLYFCLFWKKQHFKPEHSVQNQWSAKPDVILLTRSFTCKNRSRWSQKLV